MGAEVFVVSVPFCDRLLRDGTVIVDGDRIVAVGPRDAVPVEAGWVTGGFCSAERGQSRTMRGERAGGRPQM